MNRVATVSIVIVIALACVLGASLVVNEPPNKHYSITYELDGGTISEDAPKQYTPGDELEIPNPSKTDLIFDGWFLDKDYETLFTGDTTDLTGNITLYALWGDDLSGHSITFNKSGYLERGFDSYTMSGTLTCTYLYYNEDKSSYYIQNDDVTTYDYKYIGVKTTLTDSATYWSSEIPRTAEYLGTETITTANGEVLCDVVKYTSTSGTIEKQWTDANGWITYKIESYYETFGSYVYFFTYEYAYDEIIEIESSCELTVLSGYGIEVTGNESPYKLGATAKLKAVVKSETDFAGWYDSSFNLISKDKEVSIIIGGSVTVYALNGNDTDMTLASDTELDLDELFGLTDATYVIKNLDTDYTVTTSGEYTFPDGGKYSIVADTEDGNGAYFMVMVTGDADRTFTWKYNNKSYTVTIGIDYEDLLYAREYYTTSQRQQSSDHERDKTFVTLSYTDSRMAPYMEELVDKMLSALREKHPNITESMMLEYILKFTQYIEYQSDSEYMGYTEYWKFPIETLYDQGGDCEDTSILFCAIAHQCREEVNLNYKTALLLLPSHMAGAVKQTGSTEWSYCETTSTDYKLGEIPSGMKSYTSDKRYYTLVEIP
ncbi:MAG: InlB B-repeat-containing protein [Candidatus Methanomethylophilaceae archaeon]|nr:InlB B-repeat-containing protein [Candidatus Methanomethylophilaceae archaeon]